MLKPAHIVLAATQAASSHARRIDMKTKTNIKAGSYRARSSMGGF